MASYVYVKNPNGTTYVYENESYWDKTEQKTKHHRKCVGKLHPKAGKSKDGYIIEKCTVCGKNGSKKTIAAVKSIRLSKSSTGDY